MWQPRLPVLFIDKLVRVYTSSQLARRVLLLLLLHTAKYKSTEKKKSLAVMRASPPVALSDRMALVDNHLAASYFSSTNERCVPSQREPPEFLVRVGILKGKPKVAKDEGYYMDGDGE